MISRDAQLKFSQRCFGDAEDNSLFWLSMEFRISSFEHNLVISDITALPTHPKGPVGPQTAPYGAPN